MYLESCNCNPILYLPSSPSETHSQGQKVGTFSQWERETENQYDIEFYPGLVTLLTDTPRYCYFKTCLAVIPLSVQWPGQTCHKGSPACLLCVTTQYFSYIIIIIPYWKTRVPAWILSPCKTVKWASVTPGGRIWILYDTWHMEPPSSDWVMSPWHRENISPFLKALIRIKPNIYVEIFRREKL